MSNWAFKLPWDSIDLMAYEFDLDPRLIGAMCQVESAGNTWACRYERRYKDAWIVTPKKFAKSLGQKLSTEIIQQKTSWSMMQIMGATARDLGFESYLSALASEDVGLFWACKYFKIQCKRYTSTYAAIASYNAGSVRLKKDGTLLNLKHVERVRAHAKEIGLIIPSLY